MFKKKKKIQPTTNPAINNRIERLHESTFTLEMRVFDTASKPPNFIKEEPVP